MLCGSEMFVVRIRGNQPGDVRYPTEQLSTDERNHLVCWTSALQGTRAVLLPERLWTIDAAKGRRRSQHTCHRVSPQA
jgi:hypothetical protein